MKYHVHVYEVERKYEIDLEGETGMDVRKKAIEIYYGEKERLKEVPLDCRVIVFVFDGG